MSEPTDEGKRRYPPTLTEVKSFVASLDPDLQQIWTLADRRVVESADTGSDDFQLAAQIRDFFVQRCQDFTPPSMTMQLPQVDEWGRPLTKMPNCPRCFEDELGMMSANGAMCYRCCLYVERDPADMLDPIPLTSQRSSGL